MRSIRSHLSFANVVSVIALFVALGGASYAAISLPPRSVGTAQLKRDSVTGAKIKTGSVVSSDLKNGSLLLRDFKAGQLPAGAPGRQGAAGAQGRAGPAGPAGSAIGKLVVRRGAVSSIPAGTFGIVTASCLPGERAVSGGGAVSGSTGWSAVDSFPTPTLEGDTPTGWRFDAQNATGNANNLQAIVVCTT